MAYDVLGLGQPLLDHVFFVEDSTLKELGLEKGGSEQVTYEQLQALIAALRGGKELITAGGSCSNTLKCLSILGEQCALIGKLGGDDGGKIFESAMRDKGIICLSAPTKTPTGRVVCMVTPDGERTMRAYLGASIEMTAAELVPEDFAETKLLHVEGYSMYNRSLLTAALNCAKRAGATVSFDCGSFEVVRSNRNEMLDMLKKHVNIVFANSEEAFVLTNERNAEQAVSALAPMVDVAVVMMGGEGCWVQQGTEKFKCPSYPSNPVDTTGAGDLFAAGFLHAYMEGYSMEQCARLASLCGAAVVEQVGTELSAEKIKVLKGRINDMSFTSNNSTSSSSSSPSSEVDGSSVLLSTSATARHEALFSIPVAIPAVCRDRDTFC